QGSTYGIYTRLFSAAGVPQGSPYYLAGTGSADSEATLAMNAGGAFTIAWTHTAGQTQSVLMQRFSAAGAPVGSPVTVSSVVAKTGSAHQPSVAMDSAGDVVLAYADTVPPLSSNAPVNNQVKALYCPAAGAPAPLKMTSLPYTSQPSAAMNAAGAF